MIIIAVKATISVFVIAAIVIRFMDKKESCEQEKKKLELEYI